ncbi:MAG: hypothetical protein JWQ89_4536 [Devosia sp.]|nr:hypothetical protein [Devosia sp.]
MLACYAEKDLGSFGPGLEVCVPCRTSPMSSERRLGRISQPEPVESWIPAFAGMTSCMGDLSGVMQAVAEGMHSLSNEFDYVERAVLGQPQGSAFQEPFSSICP